MRRIIPLALLAVFILSLSAPAWSAPTERRVALVIGNGAYKDGPLKNPVNDARDMAATLKGLGFEVILRENAGLRQMEDALDQFWASLRKGGTGLFFFAGHGMQVKGVNYLVPVDARISVEQDVKSLCLDAGRVLGRMENAGNGLNIVLLDACRNNPFARSWRSADAGLAKMDAPTGTLIGYATAPDSVAADGVGRNGVYTQHLLREMRVPGQTIETALKHVRIGVLNDTGRRQTPWESSSLTGDFSFRPGADGQHAPPVEVALATAPKQTPPPLAAEHKVGDTWTDPVTGMEFVWVPGGTFEMGRGPWAGTGGFLGNCDSDEKPVHTVRLSGFWMGKFEVTQGQWEKVMGNNPSNRQMGDNYPVEWVNWLDVKRFISKLSALSSVKFRLPTEAEWEYAARSGGRPEMYAGGDDIDRVAWYKGNSGGSTHEVGARAPNGLGLYDMSGNVWEWVEDVYGSYSSSAQDNPIVAGGGVYRVLRGGSYVDSSKCVRAALRLRITPDFRSSAQGFRLARTE